MTPKREPAPPPPSSGEEEPTSLPALLGQIDAIAEGAPDTDSVGTGFPSLDRSLGGGLRRGDLAILGGDVGSGHVVSVRTPADLAAPRVLGSRL